MALIPKYDRLLDEIREADTVLPGGVTTNIQYNDGGTIAGDNNLTWDKTGKVLHGAGSFTFGSAAGNSLGDLKYLNAAAGSFIGIYDPANSLYFGLSAILPPPGGTASVGGYYKGMGIGGATSGAGNPIFGVLSSTQNGNGYGTVTMTVYDNNRIVTYNHVLDDGSGNMGLGNNSPGSRIDISGAMTQRGMALPAVAPAGQGRLYFDSTSNHFFFSENTGAYQQLGGATPGTITNPIPSSGQYWLDTSGSKWLITLNTSGVFVSTLVVVGTGTYYASLWGLFANIE